MATLAPEQRAIAERLANEGIRAVRQATQEESESAAGGEVPGSGATAEARLAAVESLFSDLRAADWQDRAEAARGVSDEVDLRDLRSVVAGTPQHIADEETRDLADELRRNLAARVDREHSAWIADLGSLLRKGRGITALRVSQRPPKTGTPLPESLAGTLQESAASQLNEDAEDDLWVRMLEAAAQSPIRLVLVAASLPAEPSERLLRTVRRFGDRLPALRAQFADHLELPAESEPPGALKPPAEPEVLESVEPPAEPEVPESVEPPAEPEVPESVEPPAEPEVPGDAAAAAPVESTADAPPTAVPDDTGEEAAGAADPSVDDVPDADVAQEVPQPTGEVEVV